MTEARVRFDGKSFGFPVELRPCATGVTVCHDVGRFYEEELLADSLVHLTPGAVVVDGGANLGNHTVFWAGVAGCNVHAFEPDPALGVALSAAVGLNHLRERVIIHYVALASRFRTLRSVKVGGEPGNRRYIPDDADVGAAGTVDGERLDLLVTPDLMPAVIKLDLEGGEWEAIQGAFGLLAGTHKPVLYIEAWVDDDFQLLDQFLKPLGYKHADSFGKTYKWTAA